MSSSRADKVIVVGGGLAGLSAAHTVLERGGRVLLLDKNPFLGGNSTKATSGINAALTPQQIKAGIPDSVDQFLDDTASSAQGKDKKREKKITEQAKVLVLGSAPAVDWLINYFGLDLSLISRLGGHTFPRTHRGKEKFPGMTITYALMEKLELIAKSGNAKIVTECKVEKLITGSDGSVIGVEWAMVGEEGKGKTGKEYGPVVIATGGFGADFAPDGLLAKLRPELMPLPSTNGEHCTGDGIKMSMAIGANTVDLNQVQVHPTGLVHPDEPNAKWKFLAAEALRGVGGLLLNREGDRFCDELGTRDYCSGKMWENNKAPYRLILNKKGMQEIEWHCKHYAGRGLMKRFATGADLAKEMGISTAKLADTYAKYNANGKDPSTDPFGKKFFINMPFQADDEFWVAVVCPVVHYTMGGVQITPAAEVQKADGSVIPGLFASGEVTGGVHGNNRLGGSSLLDCVVYGRVSGGSAAKYLFNQALTGMSTAGSGNSRIDRITRQLAPGGFSTRIDVEPTSRRVTFEISWPEGDGKAEVSSSSSSSDSSSSSSSSSSSAAAAPAASADAAPAAAAPAEEKKSGGKAKREYTLEEVAQHKTDKDCWVVVNSEVLDVTKFLPKHPGGKPAIMLYAGKDATAEFNMLHKSDVVEKYAPETVIGTLKGGSAPSH